MNDENIYTIEGNYTYTMLESGVFINVRDKTVLELTDGKYKIALYGIQYTVKKDWLEDYARYMGTLINSVNDQVTNIKFVRYGTESHGISVRKLPLFIEPVEITKDGTVYRLLPAYPFIAISENGKILHIGSGSSGNYTPYNDTARYPAIHVTNYQYRKVSMRIHRLVAMAWVPNDDYVSKPIVDRIDGDVSNYVYTNLEWVSFAENSRRMFDTGLRTDNVEVVVKDYDTGIISAFSTVTEACKFMGRGRINRIKEYCASNMMIKGRYQIKLMGDKSPWVQRGENHPSGKKVSVRDKQMQAINRSTGVVVEAGTSKDLGALCGLSKSLMRKALDLGEDHCVSGHSVRYKSELPWKSVTKVIGRANIKVSIEHSKTGEVQTFDSLRALASFLGVDRKTVTRAQLLGISIKDFIIIRPDN